LINEKRDIDLIKEAKRGKEIAFKTLYEKYKQRLFLVCLRYVKQRGAAEDCLQEGFINIFKNLEKFDASKGQFESWAKRVVTNVCLEKLRKSSLYLVEVTQAYSVETQDISVLSQLSFKEMLLLIQELPAGYRTIFNMYVIDGYTHREIADALDISVSTSKTQLMKARLILQKKLISKQGTVAIKHG